MNLHELKPTPGSTKNRKRVGRGMSSGHGKTSGSGHKGQKARSGNSLRMDFEGGQTPLYKRFRKTGFKNPNRKHYATVNVERLNAYPDNTIITPDLLLKDRHVSKAKHGVKVLGNGELKKKITVKAHKFTASAEEKIKAAGGTTEVI